MSSNIRIKKVCQHCGKLFIAKTTVTQFCSDDCAKKNYKKRQRGDKIQVSNQITSSQVDDRVKGVSESKDRVESVTKFLIAY